MSVHSSFLLPYMDPHAFSSFPGILFSIQSHVNFHLAPSVNFYINVIRSVFMDVCPTKMPCLKRRRAAAHNFLCR